LLSRKNGDSLRIRVCLRGVSLDHGASSMKRRPKKPRIEPVALDESTLSLLAEALAPAELSQEQRASMRGRIMARVEPPPLTYTVRFNEGQWLSAGPGVELKILRMDRENNSQTVMFRMQPGSQIVPHPHNQEEECLVMEGEIWVGEHRVGVGDMHIARPGARHPPIVAPRGALLCIRSEIPPAHFKIT
jgi:anti-sigma factor ChrR (cupin superfamily)